MTILFALLILIILGIIFLNPKLGTFLIWPILFTYPHGWWFFNGFLPLNIGYDDLFCIVLFLVVLFRRNILGGVPVRFGYSFWVISSFMMVVTAAALFGSAGYPFAYFPEFLKEILKTGIFWCLFYAILHCIDDERDLRIQFSMFSLAAVAGAVLLIFQYFAPSLAWPWQLPDVSTLFGQTAGTIEEGGDVETQRAYGAFMNANNAACILTASLILLIGAIRLQKTMVSKLFHYGFCFMLLIAILLTKSRSGLLVLALAMVPMAFLGQNRKIPWLVITAGILVFALFTETRAAFMTRLSDIYNPASREVSENVGGRVELWKRYFETADMKTLALGQGNTGGMIRNETESHSMYVALPTVYGLGGVIWAIASFVGFVRRAWYVRHFGTPILNQVATACLWTLFAFSVYGATADAISSNYPRYLLFFLVVLVDRSFELTRQNQMLPCGAVEEYADFSDYEASPS